MRTRCLSAFATFLVLSGSLPAAGAEADAAHVEAGPDGHLVRCGDRLLVLVGDSGTQCVMQNPNIDYRSWIDDCAEAGLNAVHIWSFVAPRQNRSGSVVEARYGYVYPGITPWSRDRNAPAAHDGWPRWNLQEFDEGDDPNGHYWPRLRDLCGYAKRKGLLVGITVFFGWPKHNTPQRPDWSYHPFNVLNGGHLTEHRPMVQAVQQIAASGQEILHRPWSDSWAPESKTQWLWERFAAKLLETTQPFGNTLYVFMDERSYSEGNCGDHFAAFFRRRSAFWIDGQIRRDNVDGVVDGHGPNRDVNAAARKSFDQKPPRPFFEFELPPYQGTEVRHNLYACLLGGGHYFFHNDEGQETQTTGIMSYDRHVRNSRIERVRERLRWLGIAAGFMNEQLQQLRGMGPHNDVLRGRAGYCLARPGAEYAIYVKSGTAVDLALQGSAVEFHVTITNPRTGQRQRVAADASGSTLSLPLPDDSDWLIHVERCR